MQWINDFIRKYPQVLVTGIVPIAQIIEKLKKDYNAKDMPLAFFSPYVRDMYRKNAFYYARDELIDLRMEDIEIKAVSIPVTELTSHYTAKDFTNGYIYGTEDCIGIYAVYEEKSNYFYCNSSMLHLEIAIARGISESDIKNKSEKYGEYIGLIKRYIEDYTE